MIDSGILKDLIESYEKQHTLLITICVFIGVNIFVALVNLITQVRLKKMDTNVHKNNLREAKRLDILEKLYKKFDKLRSIFNDDNLLKLELIDTSNLLNENTLYLKKQETEIIHNYCDYFSTLLIDPRNKDIQKEKDYLEKLKKEFNK